MSKDQFVDERPEYEAPQAMHLTPQLSGTGDCEFPGSGDADVCNNGIGATGAPCGYPGTSAGSGCHYDGSAALDVCDSNGSGVIV